MIATVAKKLVCASVRATMVGLDRGPHITRYSMYRRLAELAQPRPPEERALSIAGSQHVLALLGYTPSQITDAGYPQHDMLRLDFPDASFDAVASDQVLEHVQGNPYDAVAESFRVVKPGGLVLHTTCFVNARHLAPGDFWRFTPDALRLLCERHGSVLEAAGWGNPFAWLPMVIGLRSDPVPHARWHPMHRLATWNHPNWAISVWVLARRHVADAAVAA